MLHGRGAVSSPRVLTVQRPRAVFSCLPAKQAIVGLMCLAGSSVFPFIATATFIGLEKHAILGNNYFHCSTNSVLSAGNSRLGPNKSNVPAPSALYPDPKVTPPGCGGLAGSGLHPGTRRGAGMRPRSPHAPGAAHLSTGCSSRSTVPAPSLGRGGIASVEGGYFRL